MKKTQKVKLLALLPVLAVILYGGCRGARFFRERSAARKTIEAETSEPPKVSVAPVRTCSLSAAVWVTGEVRAIQNVDVTSKLAGHLNLLRLPDGTMIEEGVEMEAGQVAAVIEHEQLAAAVGTAEAGLEAARAAHATAQINAVDAQREKKRWIGLRREGAGTQQQLDQAVTAHERAQAQVMQTQAGITQAEAALQQARVNLADATIRAPFSGIVTRKHVDEGAFVGPAVPLFRLADVSRVEIVGNIAGRHLPKIRTGETRAVLEVDAYPGKTFEGTVSRVRPELDRLTRTAAVTVRVPNPDRELLPGMYARTNILLEERRNVPVVPESALVSQEDKTLAYVVENGKINIREVETGLIEGEMHEVVNGLRPGETVVVRGHRLLSDGMTVVPVELERAE